MYTSTATSAVYAAQATALTLHPTSDIQGQSFDRYVQIFLENQDYDIAAGDPNIQYLASLGITLDNYWSITHPSQPNYVAALGADTNGVWLDDFVQIDESVETMIDLLEAGNVSWSIYGEDMPFSGFESDWVNQETGANMYVRKHNPMMSYDSATGDIDRLAKAKNLTMFYEELESGTLPQWMWITPNMIAGQWARDFLVPLLDNPNFNIDKTLVILTWDECENYLLENRVMAVLLGSAVPDSLVGTTNSTELSHYSLSKTAEVNWNLGSLGKNDDDATSIAVVLDA
ncbi:phosphate-repressible acid phosphatase precursor [Cryphonectria parasitica EP155]|uniref:Phosphate-repressible acid phosphatase n=1 Tax=Cryphonectria parasitica (strain ATCC 38755 / EP155) TaxID=660469 RepID=A0A9P4Y5T9_CRYP1|nr:phosphate-repressible acid phosphatase precursor [Cryphonectria parasitica EP155]KAF3767236.1 phosphate-repressible acid phosphatase precursor [Cryphonectria parasitica EP155]